MNGSAFGLEDAAGKNGKPVGAVMVVGGGIGGMQASLDLADSGFKVYLVEKLPAIGGYMAALDKTFPTNDCAMCTLSPRLVEVANHRNIEVLTATELLKLEGEAGHFTATVRHAPRYIDLSKCTGCGDCAEVCPVVLPDEFNRGLSERKAVYQLYPQAVPNAYAIEKKGIAPCRDACPAGQRAQGYIAHIREGNYEEALRVIKEENPFPGICGRICNHRCEDVCSRTLVDDPISVMALKRFVTDMMYEQPYAAPEPAERKYEERVAIIGAGPCGLTAAKDLMLAGYGVTVFEALPVAGGMLRVGVPEYRLPSWIIDREVQEIIDLGLDLRLNTRMADLEATSAEGFKATLIAVGAHEGQRLRIPGADQLGVWTAVDFLREAGLGHPPDLRNRQVLVLGGGNVAYDCARTAVRLGAKQVDISCLEDRETMPADEIEIVEGAEEGLRLFPARSFTRILTEEGKLNGVEATNVSFMQFEADGSLTLETVPDSVHVLDCDVVILAVGQRPGLSFISEDSGLDITRQRRVVIDPDTYATSRPDVFAAGDVTTGTAYVIDAIASGHGAAESIIKYLQGEPLAPSEQRELQVAELDPAEVALKVRRGDIKVQPRASTPVLGAQERIHSFEEISRGYTEEQARSEAERCLQCAACAECLSCYYKCEADAINYEEGARDVPIDVGALILASGFENYDPRQSSEYGFGRFPNVISGMQFERVLSPSGPYGGHLIRPSDGHEPKRIAWIQCVGSRQVERNWCSAVCCMHSTKQALIAQEHNPGTESTIYYIDYRAYGKGFEAYYERAKEEGVRYVRAMPSEIKQDPVTNNLEMHYSLPDGSHCVETFDLVVLSVGLQAPRGAQHLADGLGLELTPEGFCETNGTAIRTTREGVFVCGAFAEPKDIPETIISASGAAAKAMVLLAEGRHTLVQPREYPPERDVSGEEPRVGVFVCRCGSNIAGIVGVEAVVEYAAGLKNVVYAEENMFTCSTDTQARIREMIEEHNLNRVVVASCTPRTHEGLFQSTIREAGLNFYLFEMANIRDQCSWVHRSFPEEATRKAEDLVRMAVAKARLLDPLQRKSMEFNHDALVIGGGLVGMASALDLADQGFQVSLVERDSELGGNMRHLYYLLGDDDPQTMLKEYTERTFAHPNIGIFLGAELESFEGSLGNFQSTLKSNNGHNGYTIDHGVTIVATGARPYTPTEYLYGQDERIVTQWQLEEQLALTPDEIRSMESIVMIQCVGGRNEEHPYCSRLCCSQAVKNALVIKEINPEIEVYILYRDIRTYGLMEKYYRQARMAEVVFLRFEDDMPPKVTADGALQVRVHDAMLDTEIVIGADQVVLSVATIPHSDAAELAQLLKVPRTADGFFQEAHLKLAPVDFANDGIFLCGMAHYPKRVVTESLVQASAAAARAATILSKDTIEIEPTISQVVDEKCDGCAYCVDPCPYTAITLVEYEDEEGNIKKTVKVDEALCKGCGTCMATCPKAAIFVWHFKPEQLFAMTMAALES